MKLIKKIPFSHEEKKHEIRVFSDEKIVNIVALVNNHPHNCIRYQILIPKYLDVKKLLKSKIINHFVELTKNDIIENRWEKSLMEK